MGWADIRDEIRNVGTGGLTGILDNPHGSYMDWLGQGPLGRLSTGFLNKAPDWWEKISSNTGLYPKNTDSYKTWAPAIIATGLGLGYGLPALTGGSSAGASSSGFGGLGTSAAEGGTMGLTGADSAGFGGGGFMSGLGGAFQPGGWGQQGLGGLLGLFQSLQARRDANRPLISDEDAARLAQQASDIRARTLSRDVGNPALSGGAEQEIQNASISQLARIRMENELARRNALASANQGLWGAGGLGLSALFSYLNARGGQ